MNEVGVDRVMPRGDGVGKVLVTGGAGFIGSHLVDRLLDAGRRVRVIDDFSTGREANLARQAHNPDLEVLRGSVLDETLVAGAMHGVDLVYHLAAAVGVKHVVDDPLWTLRTNARGTEIVVEQAHARGARLLFASTSEIYGQSSELPFREDGPRVLGPTWIHRWGYSTSKALDEHLCFAYADHGLQMSIVRYFNVYGPRMDPQGYGSVIARFVSQALAGQPLTVHGDGRQTRCFTYVDEAVEATLRAAEAPEALGRAYNVGSAFEHSIEDLARAVIAATGSSSDLVHVPYEEAYGKDFADTRRRQPSVERIGRELGWRAELPLEAGLLRVIEARREEERGA